MKFIVLAVLFLLGAVALISPTTAFSATATSSALDHIVLQPNDRPTIVDLFTDHQFIATGYTKNNTELTNITFSWSVGEGIGSITENGFFTGEKGGIGWVSAGSGQITATVGVVVRGTPPPTPTEVSETEEAPETTTTVQEVAGTNSNSTSETPETVEEAAVATSVASTETPSACSTLRTWVWVLILIAYVIASLVYYLALGDRRSMAWWLAPVVITAGLIGLFLAINCANYQQWVPWTLGIFFVLLAAFYVRLLRPRDFVRPSATT